MTSQGVRLSRAGGPWLAQRHHRRGTAGPIASLPRVFRAGTSMRAVPCTVALVLLFCLSAAGPATAQTGEHDAPYSFLRDQTDQIAVPGYISGTEVVPTSDLYSGYTEFGVRVGPNHAAFPAKGRQLVDGRYPIITSYVVVGDIAYTYKTFATLVGGATVNFLHVEARNLSLQPRIAIFTASVRQNGGKLAPRGKGLARQYRFPRPITPTRDGLYDQPGYAFDPLAVYGFAGNTVTRNGQVLYIFPPAPAGGTLSQSARPGAGSVVPGTTFGQTSYRVALPGTATTSLDFRMPVVPRPATDPVIPVIAQASPVSAEAGVVARWRATFARVAQVDIPEQKVSDTYYASLMHILLPRYKLPDGEWVQTVNKLRYHAFYLRDTTVMAQALDAVGLHSEASQDLAYDLTWQQPDGLFISRAGQLDGFGQALWSFGDHFRRTGSKPFLALVYPSVKRAMAWFIAARAADPLKLLPITTPLDNELVTGHITGEDFWAYDGVQQAIALAKASGDTANAAAWTAELSSFSASLNTALAAATKRTGGYIPPALDVSGGQDWGNYWASYPNPVLPATAPAVTATIKHARARFREGIATYADTRSLHAYLGYRILETQLMRNEQADVVTGFYDELAHTTSTGGGFEANLAPFGTRVIDDATTPHGWFAAEYVLMLRNMLAREDGSSLILGGALSPAWIQPGERVGVARMPTIFGDVTWSLRSVDGGATLTYDASRVAAGTPLRFAIPSVARSVTVPGLTSDRKFVTLRAGTRGSVTFKWKLVGDVPTFDAAVTRLLGLYRQAGASSASAAAARSRAYRGPVASPAG
jgi:hypothetical protein